LIKYDFSESGRPLISFDYVAPKVSHYRFINKSHESVPKILDFSSN